MSSIELPPVEEDYEESAVKWGYINKSGELVIQPEYDDARNFSEGFAVVRIKGRWGFIDQSGEEVIPVKYKSAWAFSDGLARVQTFEDKMGFIDKTGQWKISADYEEVMDFKENRSRIRKENRFGYIDKNAVKRSLNRFMNRHPILKMGWLK